MWTHDWTSYGQLDQLWSVMVSYVDQNARRRFGLFLPFSTVMYKEAHGEESKDQPYVPAGHRGVVMTQLWWGRTRARANHAQPIAVLARRLFA